MVIFRRSSRFDVKPVCVCGRDFGHGHPSGKENKIIRFGIFRSNLFAVSVGHVARANGRMGRGARRVGLRHVRKSTCHRGRRRRACHHTEQARVSVDVVKCSVIRMGRGGAIVVRESTRK